MKRTLFFFSLFLMLILVSCSERRPSGIMSKGKLEKVLYDYHLARMMAIQSGDSIDFREHLYTDAVLRRYKITEAELDTNLLWYARHTDELYKVYENVLKRLDVEASSLGAATSASNIYAQLSSTGDTANIWNGSASYILTSKNFNNRFSFYLRADTSFYPEDRFLWHFNSHFVYSSGSRNATASLSVWYDNDSTSVRTQRLFGEGDFSIDVSAVKGHKIKAVSGFVYLDAPWSEDQKLLIITQPTLVRYHKLKPVETPKDTLTRDTVKAALPVGSGDTARPGGTVLPKPVVHHRPLPTMKHPVKPVNH